MRRCVLRAGFVACAVLTALASSADAKLTGMQLAGTLVPPATLFPSSGVPVAAFYPIWCDSGSCPGATDATVTGLTVLNFGTAPSPSGLAGLYWRAACGAVDSGYVAMTYAGLYTVDGGTYPAWTWAGSVQISTDPCSTCSCEFPLNLYADIGAAAVPGTTIKLGVGSSGGGAVGGLSDALGGSSVAGGGLVMTVGVNVKVTQQASLPTATTGDIVQFRACWSNYAAASAVGFTMTDAIPPNTLYYPDAPTNHFCGATNGFGAATVAYSNTDNSAGAFALMTGPATTAVTYLRWTIPIVGPATTGCVCFKVTVQ